MGSLLASLYKTLLGRLSPLTYLVAALYILLPGALLNFSLLWETALSQAEASYKLKLFWQILTGPLLLLEPIESLLLLLTALLLGINVALLFESISLLRQEKKLGISLGGATLVALVGSGCASCGISLLSILGISSSFLPFHGVYLYVFSSALLFASLLVSSKVNAKACRLPRS